MSSTSLTALIAGLCTAIPSIIATIASNRKHQTLIEYKINELSEHVKKHNSLVERMYAVEQRISILEEKHKETDKKNRK